MILYLVGPESLYGRRIRKSILYETPCNYVGGGYGGEFIDNLNQFSDLDGERTIYGLEDGSGGGSGNDSLWYKNTNNYHFDFGMLTRGRRKYVRNG